MRRTALLAALLVLPAALPAQSQYDVTPRPVQLDPAAADFVLRATTRIALARGDTALRPAAELLQEIIRSATDWPIPIVPTAGSGDIVIERLRNAPADSEAYELRADPGVVRIRAGSLRGAVWAVQSLRQLLPPAFEGDGRSREWWPVRGAGLSDSPRYAWRGVLLDVARHWLPPAEVRRQIDLMSRYKLNVLHWHLTDDQGWRLEITRYPRLTSTGAWRTENGARYGGFYTQDDVRGIVEYARRRGITVVPEIEMPGHATAAIAAYPELGCTGQPVTVPITWGVFDDIFCAGNERTFEFLFNVLDEVVALFPSRYVHLGGDEVPKARWQQCAMCQQVMRRESLRDAEQLQSWFLSRVARHLESRGRRAIGWDEILEGGAPAGVAVQVWRDTAAISHALAAGAPVIASPDGTWYLNQGAAQTTLERVYFFDPAAGRPAEQRARVLGGEATLWSEYIDANNIDVMAWPRLLAFAEALWSGKPGDYLEFRGRLPRQYERLGAAGVRFGPEDRDVMRLAVSHDSMSLALRISTEPGMPEAVVRYAVGGAEPTAESPAINGTVALRTGPVTLRTFVHGRPTLQRRRIDFAEHRARGRPVTVTAPSRNYPGTGSRTLSDGLLGSDDHHDGLWNGWQGRDVDVIIDLGAITPITSVEASLLHSPQSWILLPASMTVYTSGDGSGWNLAGTASQPPVTDRAARRARLTVPVTSFFGQRYIRVTLSNGGPLPAWHAAAGRPSWIFADEIIVR